MKTGKIQTADPCREYRVCPICPVSKRIWWIAILLLGLAKPVCGQDLPFQNGEELNYTIHYKYGLITMKGGSARYRINTVSYNRQPALKSSLDFKTTAFFDKIFIIRDTLNSYASTPDLTPLYHDRSVNEGNYHFTEEMKVRKHSDTYTELSVKRMHGEDVRMDTLVSVPNLGYDLLNLFLYIRSLDYTQWNPGDIRQIVTFLGERNANIRIRYDGQAVIEKSASLKYKALHLTVDIADQAFSESKSAMEVWLSDDANHLPLKLKAKLKIGAAEAELSSWKNLKYPLTSEIKINGNNTRK